MLRTDAIQRPTGIEDLLDGKLIARLGQLDLSSRKVFAGKLRGERRSKKRGESIEFADHRAYVVGDDTRHIDWNLYARLDHLFLKLFLEEEDLSCHILLDASASADTGEPNKFLFQQRLAMALAYIGLVNLNRVAITALGGELITPNANAQKPAPQAPGAQPGPRQPQADDPLITHSIRDLRGRRRTADAARFLCSLVPGPATPFDEACKRIALTRRGRGIMIVLGDLFLKEGYDTGLRLLSGRGYDVFVIQTLSPQEVEPEKSEAFRGDLRLKDIEDADRADITIAAPLLKRYKRNLAAYCDGLRQWCAQRNMQCLTVQTDTPIDVLLLDYLRKRGVLK